MDILRKIERPTTGLYLMNKLDNKVKIVPYSEIHKYDNINQLLGKYKKVILLYQTRKNFGHWCCLYENNKKHICFFDSYGIIPDDQLEFTPKDLRDDLKHEQRYLTQLLYDSGKKIEYNEYQLQLREKNINTCGRWCLVRLQYPNISINDFYHIFNSFKPLKPDILISLIT